MQQRPSAIILPYCLAPVNFRRPLGRLFAALFPLPLDNIDVRYYTVLSNNDIRYWEVRRGEREVSNPDGADVLHPPHPPGGVLRHGHHGPGVRFDPRAGPGTLYNLLDSFQQAGMIRETSVSGRKRSYLITDKGRETLSAEYRRLLALTEDYKTCVGEEETT